MNELANWWAGSWGDEYHRRNVDMVASNKVFFELILERIMEVNGYAPGSVLEFGAGTGMNLDAIKLLLPKAEMIAVEVNRSACDKLCANSNIRATIECSILEYQPEIAAELVLTKGLLIHIAPEHLPKAYQVLHATTREWLLVCEYYCPTPREITYRGNEGKAWARDFAGELLDTYKDLELVDYGFTYHRDLFPQDDITFFLMRKNG